MLGAAPLRRPIAAVLLAAWLASCGAVKTRQDSAPLATMTADAALIQARQQWRTGRAVEVVATLARTAEPLPPELHDLGIRALWTLDRQREAVPLEQRLTTAARTGDAGAARALADLARWHLRGKRIQPAWRAISTLIEGGCQTARTCQLAASVLLAMAPGRGEAAPVAASFVDRTLAAAPPGPPRRDAWLHKLAEDLAVADHLEQARAVIERARNLAPNNPKLWLVSWNLARRVPEPEARVRWLADLQAAQLPAVLLTEIATAAEPPREPAVVASILELAAQRPDASETTWILWCHAMARAGLKAQLLATARDRLARLPSATGRIALAQALLRVGAPETALPIIQQLPATDGAVMALEADLLRQRGLFAEARSKAAAAVAAGPDRSAAALQLAQSWSIPLPGDAERWLATASETPGSCQLPAARQWALRNLDKRPNPASVKFVMRYANLLTQPAPAPCLAADAWEPPPQWLRTSLVRQLELRDTWKETALNVVRVFVEAGLEEPAMLRTLAVRRLKDGRVEDFLRLDRRARANAEAQAEDLQDDAVLTELINRPAPILVRWLRDAGVQQADDPQTTWGVAAALLTGHFAGLGRRWAEQALAQPISADPPTAKLAALVTGGAADLALAMVEIPDKTMASSPLGKAAAPDKPLAEPGPELDRVQVEVNALLALDRPDDAQKRLAALASRPDMPPRLLRVIADFAHTRGMCDVVFAVAPRLIADNDQFILRTGVKTAVDCARRMQRDDVVASLVRGLQSGRPEPLRTELLARELVGAGFNAVAIEVFEQLERIRPMSDDALVLRARALLAQGRSAEGGQMLQRMAVAAGQGRRAYPLASAAEMLENYGQMSLAETFWQRAVEMQPDTPRLLLGQVGNALRRGEILGLGESLAAFFKSGPSTEELNALRLTAERCSAVRQVYDALAGIADADRELDRFRMDLAAQLGLREAVEAGVRRLRAKGAVQVGRVPEWLEQIGAWREAREVSTEMLTAAEPQGAPQQRVELLEQAMERQRDPSSAAESLSLARLFVGRALDMTQATMQAASVLADRGLAREALAVAMMTGSADQGWRLCEQGQIQHDAGDTAAALESWRRAMATVQLDPRLRDWLRAAMRLPRELDGDLGGPVRCLFDSLGEANQLPMLTDWVRELLVLAPDSALLRAELVRLHLVQGDVPGGVQAMRDASHVLAQMLREDFQFLAERLLRDGGGPPLLRWFLEEGEGLRNEAWFVAFVASVLTTTAPVGTQTTAALSLPISVPARDQPPQIAPTPDLQARLAELRAWVATLPSTLPDVRIALSLAASSRGDAVRAVQVLGRAPLSGHDSRQNDAVQAVAGALIAASGQAVLHNGDTAAPSVGELAAGWLRGGPVAKTWGYGRDAALAVAADLVRQGHPDLVRIVEAVAPLPQAGDLSMDRQRLRLFVALAAGSEDDVATDAMAYLRGRRAHLPNIDETYVYLLKSGRIGAARRVAAMLAAEEPGLRPPAVLDATPPTPDVEGVGRSLEQFRGTAHLFKRDAEAVPPKSAAVAPSLTAGLPRDVAVQAQGLAAAMDPALAERWTAALAAHEDEAWHAWWSLLQAAEDFQQPELARTALARAAAARAPTGLMACPRLWLGDAIVPTEPPTPTGADAATLAACLRGRPIETVPMADLADLAAGVAVGVDSAGEKALVEVLVAAPQPSRVRFLEAAAARSWALDPAQRKHLAAVVRSLHDALAPARRDELAVMAMDDLGALGLGDLGVAVMQHAWRVDPEGRGQRNNLTYSQYLAGQDASTLLPVARPAEFATGGEAGYATLDTLAALAWATGDRQAATALLRRALTSSLAQPTSQILGRARAMRSTRFADIWSTFAGQGAGLPMVRLAEFLLESGAPEDARVLASMALLRPDNLSTAQRARLVLRSLVSKRAQ